MKKDKRQAIAYLRKKKISDVKDELLIMKMSHLLSIPWVRYAIIGTMDILVFFMVSYVTNLIKFSIKNFKESLRGESTYTWHSLKNLSPIHAGMWYLMLIIILIVVDIKVFFILYSNYRDINRNQKGSTRWSTLDEIKEQYPAIPLKFQYPYETYFGKGGVPVCQYGTYYNEQHELCDIDKGVIFIDRTPVNNLVIGITRSGKGEMFVFIIIDIYSRAENKEYYLNYDKEGNLKIYVSNIYYDYRSGGIRKTDIPGQIDEEQLKFDKNEFYQVLHNYEKEYNIKLELPKDFNEEIEYSFYDNIQDNLETNVVMEQMIINTSEKVKAKRSSDEKLEFKLTTSKLIICDKESKQEVTYSFNKKDPNSKKDALDQAFLYLQQINHPFAKDNEKYEYYQDAMGFSTETVKIKIDPTNTINYTDANKQLDVITDENNSILNASNAYENVEIEEIKDGIIEYQKEKINYTQVLRDIALNNKIHGSKKNKDGSIEPGTLKFERNHQASMVVSDPKLELFIASKPILELRGYYVYCINLINPYESSGYNPVQLITDTYKSGDPAEASAIARSLATSIFASDTGGSENSFFYDNAAFLTAALIMSEVIDQLHADEEANKEYLQEHIEATIRFKKLSNEEKKQIKLKGQQLEELKKKRYQEVNKYNLVMLDREINQLEKDISGYNYKMEDFVPRHDNEKKINLPNVLMKFTRLAEKTLPPEVEGAEPRNALDVFFQNRDSLDVARCLYSAIRIAGGERTKGSVYSTVLSKLTGFMDDKIRKMTAFSSFQLSDIGFGKRPIAVFVALPDYDSSNTFIQSIFISQVYYALAKKATGCGGKCKREVIFLLDEFGNIPCINNMASMVTVCLGRNIRFNLIVQSYSQLDKEYGEHDSDTIYGNCGNQIYIQTDNYDTAEQFSNLIGKETIVNVTRMGGEISITTQKQYTESTEEKPLLNPNELMEFVEGECVVKRVMMRKDQYNQNVKPRPIYNTGETAFPLRYQYLADWYNTENKWENLHAESCARLDISQYVSDFDQLLLDIENSITEEYQAMYQTIVHNYESNKDYPLKFFVNSQDICKKLITQIPELRQLSDNKLKELKIADVEKYYIQYESNLPAFRQRMYEVTDWSRVDSKTLRSYSNEIIRFFQMILGDTVGDVWELYGFEDEDVLLDTSIDELLMILEDQEISESNILQFKAAVDKYDKEAI